MKWLKDYKKKWGLFGLVFPILGLIVGLTVLMVSLKFGAGFDVFAWLGSPKAIPIYFVLLAIVAFLIRLYCSLGERK